MKKILLLLSVVWILSSCNTSNPELNTVKEYIYKTEESKGCKVKEITIREINVEAEFYMYTQEYRCQWDGSPKEYKEIINFKLNHQKGIIYVAKIKKYNKFGGKVPPAFRTYTINDSGNVYEYIGLDRQTIFEAAYPLYRLFGYYND